MYNTAQELIEAHRMTQLSRLAKTTTGKHLLQRLQLNAPIITGPKLPIPIEKHARLKVRPLPRNMLPIIHQGRREQRVKALAERYPIRPSTVYVDAAEYRHKNSFALAIINAPNTPLINSLTIRTSEPATVEEAEIALALSHRLFSSGSSFN